MNNKLLSLMVVSAIGLTSSSVFAKSPSVDKSLLSQTVSQQSMRGVINIADKVENNVAMVTSSKQVMGDQVIYKPGASFIKVHFSELKLPEGSYVEVSNADGSEVYRYGVGFDTPKTFDASIGDDGVNSFSSMSISGAYAVIRVVGGLNNINAAEHQVKIDHYMQGYSEERIQELIQDPLTSVSNNVGTESTCGVNERRDVQCWADTHPSEVERSRPVARLLMNGSGLCTGWRVGANNHMFTNNHCVDTNSKVQTTEVWFNYQRTGCGSGGNTTPTKVNGASMLKTDYTLDYTLFTINNFSSVSSFGYLGLDPREAVSQEQIFIPQHGAGNPKELAIESDQNAGNLCRIDAVSSTGRGANTDMGYKCDTIGGSSGSPVLAKSSNKVLALHHFGGCNNQGVKISRIWPQVSSFFNNVVPKGDNEGPGGNVPPVAKFTSSCNGLVCTFDASTSTDSDGSIASYSWNFGDSSAAGSGANPSHTYSSNGTYNVTLTVTDNQSATGTVTHSVVANDGSGGGNQLTNGVAKTGLSGAKGGQLKYTLEVPAGATNLSFAMNGGTGDADLYVKFGSEPTLSSYDCRPYSSGNNENCNISNVQAGTYHVMINGYTAFSGVSLTGSYTAGSGNSYTNSTDFNIPDNNATGISSPINVTNGGSSSTVSVKVDIKHTYIGDLIVDLIDPSGGVHNLHNRTGSSADNILKTYSVNVGNATRTGTWNLRVKDRANIDTGKIDSWTITL